MVRSLLLDIGLMDGRSGVKELKNRDFMTKKDMLLLISVNDEINKVYDGIGEIFGEVSNDNLPFQQFTDMILDYTHSGDEATHEKMWEVLIDRNASVEERYEKMGFNFPDVERQWLHFLCCRF